MRHPFRASRRVLVSRLSMVMLVVGLAVMPVATSAQYYGVYSNAPFDQLVGLQFAGQRLYQGEFEQTVLTIYVDVAQFDTEANAATGLEMLSAYYLDAYANAGSPIAFEPVDPPAEAPSILMWQGFLDIGNGPYAEASLAQVLDGVSVFTAFVVNYAYEKNHEEFAAEVTGSMLEAILANPAPMATPAAIDPASAMARLPLVTDEVPAAYGMTYVEDSEWFALETGALEESGADPSNLLYGDAEGLVAAVNREYSNDDEGSEAIIELAGFDSADHAATGFMNAEASLTSIIESAGDAFGVADVDVSADAFRAWSGTQVEDGTPATIIIAQSGEYVVSVLVAAEDADLALALAEDLVQATLDAEATTNTAEFDMLGNSTGGIWDKLPVTGDEVLRDLTAYWDTQLFP